MPVIMKIFRLNLETFRTIQNEKRLQKELESGCPYPATVANLEDSIANYKRTIAALSA